MCDACGNPINSVKCSENGTCTNLSWQIKVQMIYWPIHIQITILTYTSADGDHEVMILTYTSADGDREVMILTYTSADGDREVMILTYTSADGDCEVIILTYMSANGDHEVMILTYTRANGDHKFVQDLAVIHLQCLDRAVQHTNTQDSQLVLVFKQILKQKKTFFITLFLFHYSCTNELVHISWNQ